jgi:hypothetical protein
MDILLPTTLAAGQRVKDAIMILPDQAAKVLIAKKDDVERRDDSGGRHKLWLKRNVAMQTEDLQAMGA